MQNAAYPWLCLVENVFSRNVFYELFWKIRSFDYVFGKVIHAETKKQIASLRTLVSTDSRVEKPVFVNSFFAKLVKLVAGNRSCVCLS